MEPLTTVKYDTIIVGAGVIGLATALKLLENGAKVKILERGRVGMESSWAGGGILSPIFPWDYTDAVSRLAQYSAGMFSEWASALQKATGIDPEYHQCGMCLLPPFNLGQAKDWCSKNSVDIRLYALSIPIPIGNRESVNGSQSTVQAALLPGIAQIRNPRLLQALHRRVNQLGGHIIENCCVYDWIVGNNKILSVQSSCGPFEADNYIIAAGAWSKMVLSKYALALDIHPVKGQMLLFKFDTPQLSTIIVKEGLYLISRKDGHLLVGSTLENTGFNKQTTASVRKKLLETAISILPQLRNMPVIRQWSGLRPGSPLNIPTIGQHPEIANLYLNSGHYRYGVTMAPASAEILVNEITRSTQPLDVSPYQSGWSQHGSLSTIPTVS